MRLATGLPHRCKGVFLNVMSNLSVHPDVALLYTRV